jgi:hypothetical protein
VLQQQQQHRSIVTLTPPPTPCPSLSLSHLSDLTYPLSLLHLHPGLEIDVCPLEVEIGSLI